MVSENVLDRNLKSLYGEDLDIRRRGDAKLATTGSAVWDFLGQAAWGAGSGVMLDAPAMHDVFLEATDPNEKTWEETIAGAAAGDWEQLTGAGKAGNIIGQAIGMIPSFFYGGAFTKTGMSLLSGVGAKGLKTAIGKYAVQKGGREFSEWVGKEGFQSSLKKVGVKLDDKLANDIIEESYSSQKVMNSIFKTNKGISQEIVDKSVADKINFSLKSKLGLADEFTKPMSRELVEIVTRNDVHDAEKLLLIYGSRIANSRVMKGLTLGQSGEKLGMFLGATAYDGMIGASIGAARGLSESIGHAVWDVQRNDLTGQFEYDSFGEKITALGALGNVFSGMLYEGVYFAPLGITKYSFGKWGTTGSHLPRAGRLLRKSFSAGFKDVDKMSKEALERQLTAMDVLADGNLAYKVGLTKKTQEKWAAKGARWWQNDVAEESTMKEFLKDIRRTYLVRAPKDWAKEFGGDMIASLPRMAVGTVAMNLPGFIENGIRNGFSQEQLENSLGTTWPEIASNVFVGMYFSRKPHSFRTPTDSKVFNTLFATGKTKEYMGFKNHQLRKTIGGLEMFGADGLAITKALRKYGDGSKTWKNYKGNPDSAMKRKLDSSEEFSQIDALVEKYDQHNTQNNSGGADLETSYNAKIAELLKDNKITTSEAFSMQEQLYIAKTIMNVHRSNQIEPIDVSFTKDQALSFVDEVSKIEFSNEKLTRQNINFVLEGWWEKQQIRAAEEPINIHRSFLEEAAQILGIEGAEFEWNRETGQVTMPRVSVRGNPKYQSALQFINETGFGNNWLNLLDTKEIDLTPEQIKRLDESYDKHSEAFMSYVYGDDWKSEFTSYDDNILVNDSWHIPYGELLRTKQYVNAYEAITKGPDYSSDPIDVGNFQKNLEKFLLFKDLVEIDEKALENADLADDIQVVKNVYSVTKMLRPNSLLSRKGQKMSSDQVQTFAELTRKITGDLFTGGDPNLLIDFKEYSQKKSMSRLGLNDIPTGTDVKVAAIEMARNPLINQGEDGSIILPSSANISKKLQGMYARDEITLNDKKKIEKFYSHLVTDVEKSNVPIRFDDLVEKTDGDFVRSIQEAISIGETAMNQYTKQDLQLSLTRISNTAAEFKKVIDVFEQGMANLDDDMRKDKAAELGSFIKVNQELDNLKITVKNAIESGDIYTLRALNNLKGDIDTFINAIESKGFDQTSMDAYRGMLLTLNKTVLDEKQKIVLKDQQLAEKLKQRLETVDIPSKDVQHNITKLNIEQFKAKYRFTDTDFDEIFDMDKKQVVEAKNLKELADEYFSDMINDRDLNLDDDFRRRIIKQRDEMYAEFKDLTIDLTTSEGRKAYQDLVLKPIKLKMEAEINIIENDKRLFGESLVDIPSASEMDYDFHTIVSNLFSKTDIKVLQVDMKDNALYLEHKVQGFTQDRGFTGILYEIDPSQNSIYLANTSGVDNAGNVIRNISGNELNGINIALQGGKFNIVDINDKSDFLRGKGTKYTTDPLKITQKNVDNAEYTLMNLNEGTSLIFRSDSKSELYNRVKMQFKDPEGAFEGGGMNLLFRAALGDSKGNLVDSKHRSLLARLQKPKTANDLKEAIEIIRVLKNNPLALADVIATDGTVDIKKLKNYAKRDKMNEPKSGFIPTDDNIQKTRALFQNAESDFYRKVYDEVEEFYEPGRNLKILSIDDEGPIVDLDGNPIKNAVGDDVLYNVFDSFTKARVQLQKKVDDGLMTKPEMEAELAYIKEVTKSTVDGETYLSKKAYLAMLSMMGIREDMVILNNNNEVVGFKSGGIKPTLTHSKLITTKGVDYGKAEEFFLKTAFKYDAKVAKIIDDLDVDVLTFGSGAKINQSRAGAGQDIVNKNVRLKGVDSKADVDKIEGTWIDYLSDTKNMFSSDSRKNAGDISKNIVEVPLSALSLRTISKEKRPSIGQNAGVHMDTKNGIADWIGLSEKLSNFETTRGLFYGDPHQVTQLGKVVMGFGVESGDPASVNSPITSILENDGLILEPHIRRELEMNLIGYSLNDGSIAGGIVDDGSFDVMSADFGNLRAGVRGDLEGKQTVRYFGEFLPSYYAANSTKWKTAKTNIDNVQNVIIQRVEYSHLGTKRLADGFLIEIDGQKLLQVEGSYIGKDGKIIDIDNGKIIQGSDVSKNNANEALNKAAWEKANNNEESINKFVDKNGNKISAGVSSLNEVAHIIRNWTIDGKNENIDASVGMLNVRQPRNMIGDVVISRMAYNADVDGFHVDEMSGNVSRMNHLDAIKPQDADFDFDKSFNYVAAPGLFWQQANKNAGEISRTGKYWEDHVKDFFNPANEESAISKKLVSLYTKRNLTYNARQLEQEVNMARGHYVKMHQTITYLAGMFKNEPQAFATRFDSNSNQTYAIRMGGKNKYINSVNMINKMALKFIDMYDKLPSEYEASIEGVVNHQNQIWFGPGGLFEFGVINKSTGSFELANFHGENAQIIPLVTSINNRLVRPLNKYLRLNQGMEADETGITRKASLKGYHEAWHGLINSSLNHKNTWGIENGVDLSGALQIASRFMSQSRNPFDVAMNRLSQEYKKTNSRMINGTDMKNSQQSTLNKIIDYIDYGGPAGTTLESLKSLAIKNLVDTEGHVIALQELRKKRRSLTIQVEETQQFVKGRESTKLDFLLEKQKDLDELIATSEQVVANLYEPNADIYPPKEINLNRKKNIPSDGTWVNNTGNVIVVRDATGKKVVQVIAQGASPSKPIYQNQKMFHNARRFISTDSFEQNGLDILFDAFSGKPVVRTKENGVWAERRLGESELKIVSDRFKILKKEVDKRLGSMPNLTKADKTNLRLERESIIMDHLFSMPLVDVDEGLRKALILHTLVPMTKKSEFTQNHVGEGRWKYDDVLYENPLSKDVMSLLVKMSSEQIPGFKDFSKQMLKDIELMKVVSHAKKGASDMEIKMFESKLYTEDVELRNNRIIGNLEVQEGVIQAMNHQDKLVREAAATLVELADGTSGLVDGKTLYKAGKILQKAGVDIGDQWGSIKWTTNEDGTLKKFGQTRVKISLEERMNRKDLGDLNGRSDSGQERLKKLFDCYN